MLPYFTLSWINAPLFYIILDKCSLILHFDIDFLFRPCITSSLDRHKKLVLRWNELSQFFAKIYFPRNFIHLSFQTINKHSHLSFQTNIVPYLFKQALSLIFSNKHCPLSLQTNIITYLFKQTLSLIFTNKHCHLSFQTNIITYLYKQTLSLIFSSKHYHLS